MKKIKTTNNLEFDLIYGDGTKKRVQEGVLFEVKDNAVLFHSGTSRPEVILALPEAITEVISKAKLTDIFLRYLEKTSDRILGNDWIPVEERLPDEPEEGYTEMDSLEEYIVMIEGADEPTVLYYAGDGEWYREGELYSVLAWMPLPEPYKPEKQKD